jgi:hypothetical protein
MTYRVLDQVHVTAHINGDSLDLDFAPGEVDVLPEIGELLVAQGLAVLVTAAEPEPEPEPEPVDEVAVDAEVPADEAVADDHPAARKASKSRTNTPEA